MINNRKNQIFYSLETLRILAALAVVFAHSGDFEIPLLRYVLGSNLLLGSIGVDIFFIISGFVMYQSAALSSLGWLESRKFLINRGSRVFPLYWLVTILWVLKLIIQNRPVDISVIIKSLLLIPWSSDNSFTDPLVILGWTLRYELYFYILVAIGIGTERILSTVIIGIFLSILVWLLSGFYFGAPIILEFLAGYFLAVYRTKFVKNIHESKKNAILSLVLVSFLVLIAATGHDYGYTDKGIYSNVPRMWIVYYFGELPRVVAWGIPSFLLVFTCIRNEYLIKWPFASLGKFTFSVYLLQIFTIPVSIMLMRTFQIPDFFAFVTGLTMLAVVSFHSYRFIELTMMLKIRSKLKDYI